MAYKILGISGSPVNKGNLDTVLGSIMEMALEKGLETETINIGINEDQAGIESAKAHLSRALELATLINKGQQP